MEEEEVCEERRGEKWESAGSYIEGGPWGQLAKGVCSVCLVAGESCEARGLVHAKVI